MGTINTALGKELRKMRIDAGEVLKTMADKLGVTSSYLSAIEVGKRTMSDKLLNNLQEVYQLSEEMMLTLRSAIEKDKPAVEINLTEATKKQRSVALAFARTFRDLDQETLESISKLLNKGEDINGDDI